MRTRHEIETLFPKPNTEAQFYIRCAVTDMNVFHIWKTACFPDDNSQRCAMSIARQYRSSAFTFIKRARVLLTGGAA